MDYPFGPLAPDQGAYAPGALQVADGVIPIEGGYGPFPAPVMSASATALAAAPRGLFAYQTADGTWAVVAATSSAVYKKATDDTWSTTIDSGLSVTPGDDVCFLRFGTKLLYTNSTQGLRAYDVESAGAASAVAAAKTPRWMFECGNILFGLDCIDFSGSRNNRLMMSSAISDHTNWTTRGADYQALESGGALIWGGKISDTAALVLQQREVRLLQVGNVGGPLWGIKSISSEFGATGAKSVVSFDGMVFWFATDGFRMFGPEGIKRIGAGRVDQWFLGLVDQTDLSLIQGTIDPFRKNVLWRWKRSSSSDTVIFNDIIGYNWQFDRWFTLTVDTTYLGFSAQVAATWDAYAATATWDSLASSLIWDGRLLSGGQPLLGMMDSTYIFEYFAGTAMAATLAGSEAPSRTTALVNWATPSDDSADGTLAVGVKAQLSDTITWKTGVAKAASGRVPIRGRGKVVAFRRVIPAASTWTYTKGVDYLDVATGGPR